MTIEAVIFDIGNVLIEWQPERYYDQEIGEERRRRLFEEVDLHGMNDRIDRGAEFRTTIYDTAERFADWRDEIRQWHDNWIKLATPEIPHSVRLLRALREKGVPVFALTNFGVGSFDYACRHYGFLTEFDRAYVSGHMKVIKPEARIYEMVEDDCGIAPDRLIFTDDRADNVAVAGSRGWRTHLFEGPEGWAARLVAEGLLTESEAA